MPDLRKLLRPNPFAADNGLEEEAVKRACALPAADPARRMKSVLEALNRVFVAVFPHAHPKDVSPQAKSISETASAPQADRADRGCAVVSAAGTEAVAVFTSARKLAEAYPKARPQPILISDAAKLALRTASGRIVLNPAREGRGGAPGADSAQTFCFSRSVCVSLAGKKPWRAPWENEEIRQKLLRAAHAPSASDTLCANPQSLTLQCTEQGRCRIDILFPCGTRPEAARAAVSGVIRAVNGDELLKSALDWSLIVPRVSSATENV